MTTAIDQFVSLLISFFVMTPLSRSVSGSVEWDWSAVRAFCLREARRVLGTSAIAEDAAQEAALRAWRQRHRCVTPERPAPWIATIARREALRTLGRDAPEPLAEDDPGSAAQPDSAEIELRADLRRTLAQQPLAERDLLFARFWQDRSLEEIARREGLNPATVRVRLHRSLRRMRKNLSER
jgi:RNA polymerase sigma-70 factor, ECF subfamily